MGSEKKKISAIVIPQKVKNMTIEVKIINEMTGKPITGLTVNDFQINGKDANGHLYAVEEIKPGVYLPTIKDQFPGIINPKRETKLYECENVTCNLPKMDSKFFKNV